MKSKQNYLKTGLLLTALALLAFVSPAMAKDQVPFKGIEVGAFSDVSFQFPFGVDRATAEGEATHIGHYTLIGDFVANVLFGTAAGTFTMTADNGAMLFLYVEG